MGPAISDYDAATDVNGFTGFIPTQCMKNSSFQVEQVESPVIAIVGDSTEPAFASMVSYMETLITF